LEKKFEIITSVRKIIRAVDLFSSKLKERFGLTSSQITCLEFLIENGASPISSITKTLQLSPSMLTNIVDQLEFRKYIERVRSTKDRRVILIAITDFGMEIMVNIPDSLNKKLLRNIDTLKPLEKDNIHLALTQIISFIEADELNSLPMVTSGSIIGEEEANITSKGNFKSKSE